MKKLSAVILGLFGALTLNAQSQPFTLNGKIQGKDKGTIYVFYNSTEDKQVKDSAAIVNGAFKYVGSISEPTYFTLSASPQLNNIDNTNLASFFIEPGSMELDLTYGKFKEFALKGSKMNDDLNELNALKADIKAELKPFTDAYTKANDEYIKARKENRPQEEQDRLHKAANDVRNSFDPYYAKMDKIDFDYFLKHPDSYMAGYLMLFKVGGLPLDSVLLFYNNMTDRVKKSNFGKRIADEIVKLKKGSPGAVATNFNVRDINGKFFNLAAMKGKYVLIDFWASWCIPCREGNPHLKQLYAKYKDKGFEIVGVSDDDSAIDAWKKAVAQDGIGIWRHVLRGLKRTANGFDRSTDISENYGIHSLPTKILVDRNGLIVGRYGGGGESDEAMDKKLAEVMK